MNIDVSEVRVVAVEGKEYLCTISDKQPESGGVLMEDSQANLDLASWVCNKYLGDTPIKEVCGDYTVEPLSEDSITKLNAVIDRFNAHEKTALKKMVVGAFLQR